MAWMFRAGFEQNTITNGKEFSAVGGSPTIVSTNVRSGSYAGRISSLVSATPQYFRNQIAAVNHSYHRFYLRINTLPSAENCIYLLNDLASFVTPVVYVTLDNIGALRLYDEDGVIGSASAVLSTGRYYRIELRFDRTGASGSHIVEGKIDGVVFATASNRAVGQGVAQINLGGNLLSETQTQGDWLFDDIAVNDTTGSTETSYPGEGSLILCPVNASGSTNQWLKTAGGAGDADNYQLVDEIPTSDNTDYVQSVTVNDIDMYAVGNPAFSNLATIKGIAIDVRFANNVADAVTAFKARLQKSGGTVVESAAIIPNSTTWKTNALSAPWKSPVISYIDPDTSLPWTKTAIDNMQIGIELTAAGTNRVLISGMHLLVEFIDVAGTRIFGDDTLLY